MQFTKRDIQRIAQELARVSVKDSSFKKVTAPSDKTSIVLVGSDSNGNSENQQISTKALSKYFTENLNLADIKYKVEGQQNITTLAGLLSVLVTRLNGNYDAFPDAWNLSYSNQTVSANLATAGSALDTIISILYGVDKDGKSVAFPTSATEADINGLFTN